VNLPVITDSSTQQLEFDKGSLAAIMHDLPESAALTTCTARPRSSPTCSRRVSRPGSAQTFSQIGVLSVATGCWDNLVNQDDFMVAQPWLQGVAQAHVVTYPNSLNLFALSAG
jgi:hypothetical protein